MVPEHHALELVRENDDGKIFNMYTVNVNLVNL